MPVASPSPTKTSAGSTPERTARQRNEALDKANEVRSRRARLKREIRAGKTQISGLLLDPPDYLLTAKVKDMLLQVPKYGEVKATRALNHCRISQSKTFGGLTERQRTELAAYMQR